MSHFNLDAEEKLRSILCGDEKFKLVVLWGKPGSGKTHTIHNIMCDYNITINDIIFSSESFFPLGSFTFEDWSDGNEYTILEKCRKKFQKEECIIFQNMEKCGPDYEKLIFHLLDYHKKATYPIRAIVEYNTKEQPDNKICSLAKYIVQVKENEITFLNYLDKHFYPNYRNHALFQKILEMSNENVETFFNVLAILQHQNIIVKDSNGFYEYINQDYNVPNNVITLYMKFLEGIDHYIKEPLFFSAPLSNYIFEKAIRTVFYEYEDFEDYLNVLCKDKIIVSRNSDYFSCYKDADLFQSSYVFSTETARKAVLTRLDDGTIRKTISDYCNYFDKIYSNSEVYKNLKVTDRITLLCTLAKLRKNQYSLNQINYVVDLMKLYFDSFMYLNAIKCGNELIDSKLLNPVQLNTEAHQFWIIYFMSLLAVGEYKTITKFRNQFNDSDLNFCIALAFYQEGHPLEALQILSENVGTEKTIVGYKYSLMASIYDWTGKNKKSSKYFGLALKNCDKNSDLQHQLYKKYSLYVDFRIPECREKLVQAIDYYKGKNLKQYAECLHNYGTGCVFSFDFAEAKRKLNLSIKMLDKVCSNEIYYPLNSLAILACYNNKNYMNAINIWKQALRYNITETFCNMAIHNNMYNIYIHMEEYELAQAQKIYLEKAFLSQCSSLDKIQKEKPEIQHQLRQFYYNSGLLLEAQQNHAEALTAFDQAKKCSAYDSIMLYAVNCHIEEIKEKQKIKGKMSLHSNKKVPKPTMIEKYILDERMYLCEIMFWG